MSEPATQTPPPPPPPGESGGDNRTLMIILSYLGILCLIPLLMEKEDAEVQWHAKHGLVLFIAALIVGVGLMIVTLVPGIGTCVGGIASILFGPLYLIVAVIAIVKGVNGERFIIPGISQFVEKVNL